MHQLSALLGNTDIYLIDQILKGRYAPPQRILDAGAGGGRNLHWFVHQGFDVYGADINPEAVHMLRQNYSLVPPERFTLAPVENLPFDDAFFHHIVCSAVLHFAENEAHFEQMFGELARVLQPGGSMFLRVATDVGLADKMLPLGNGRYAMPDGSDRFLLKRDAFENLMQRHGLAYLEPFKTVLVDALRSMSVVVLGKR
jgi:ubiquinone/menaquinone biosynthesis C-methylase UbiE